MVQFYLLPPPSGNPGDKSSPSGPGVGNCLKRSCPGVRGVGQIENINFFLFHFSVDTMAPDHVEKTAYFQGKSLEIVNREEYSLKCVFDAYSNGWRSSQTKKYFFSVFIYNI